MTGCTHFLEFHRHGELRIGENAGRFLAGALHSGGVAVAISTPPSAKGIVAHLGRMGEDPIGAMQRGRLLLFESSQMLSQFSRGGNIDAERFDQTVGAAMRESKERAGGAPVHAFGDMVGVLWQRGRRESAVALEKLWIALQQELNFSLFCAYPIDVFGPEFSGDMLDGVLQTHTHLSPSPISAEFGRALDRAMEEVLGEAAARVRVASAENTRRVWPAMPKLEKMILWMRVNLPECAQAVLARARGYYQSSEPRVYLRQEHSSR